jgi:hypothetical protein
LAGIEWNGGAKASRPAAPTWQARALANRHPGNLDFHRCCRACRGVGARSARRKFRSDLRSAGSNGLRFVVASAVPLMEHATAERAGGGLQLQAYVSIGSGTADGGIPALQYALSPYRPSQAVAAGRSHEPGKDIDGGRDRVPGKGRLRVQFGEETCRSPGRPPLQRGLARAASQQPS